jgi:hypothetical protein
MAATTRLNLTRSGSVDTARLVQSVRPRMIAATRVPVPAEVDPNDGGEARKRPPYPSRGPCLMWRRATQRGERAEPFGMRVLTNGARIDALRHVPGWESKLQF